MHLPEVVPVFLFTSLRDDGHEAIIDKLTEDEKVAIYNDCLAKWKEEIKIEKYYDRVSGIK